MSDIEWIRESNLIEGVDDPKEDARSLRAWRWFIKQELTLETILKLHRKIMLKKLSRRDAGYLRDCGVSVGGRICPNWQNVPGLMAEWLKVWAFPKHPVGSWAAEAHIAFEHIHPFLDGNGRTGRMILNHMRYRAGYPTLCIKASERSEYYKWF